MQLWRVDLDGSGGTPLDVQASANPYEQVSGMSGLTVDDDGILYIAGRHNAGGADTQRLFTYDPASQTVTGAYFPTGLKQPYHILLKDDYVYVINQLAADGETILRLDENFENVVGYGDRGSDEPNWETLPESGNGQDLFQFYFYC